MVHRCPSILVTIVLAMITAACSGDPSGEPSAYRDAETFAAIDPVISAFIDQEGLNGAGIAVVARDVGVVHEQYWGEFDPDRVSLIASSSKMISAGVLLRLHEDGALDLDAPVTDVVDWGPGNPDVTPAQLISNSSGLVGLLPNPRFSPYLCQWTVAVTLQECGSTIFTTTDDDDDVVDPDSTFRYGGAQWQVAGAVAEAASGKSWADLLDEIYVQPCGLGSLGFANLGQFSLGGGYPAEFDGELDVIVETANPNIEGGGFVTVPDYASLLLMHLRDGMCGDTQVLSPGSLDRAHGDRIGPTYDGNAAGPAWGYGMGWWVDRETGRITDGGAFGSRVWLDLDDGYGVYLVIEATSDQGQSLSAQLYDLIEDAVLSE
jgi:CubicO group peptidase (beta-lactamase class C family)